MRVFVSYRRADVGGYAGRLSDTLVQRLGTRNVFRDVSDIAAGRDFSEVIHRSLAGCDAVLAVIGPGWTELTGPGGVPRLFEEDDYVRRELVTALERDLPVAPVLVGGASLPAPHEVPDDLRPLLQRQATTLRDETWRQDVDHLLRSLRGEPETPRGPARRRVAIAAVAGLAAIAAVAAALGVLSGSGPTENRALPACADPKGGGWTDLPVVSAGPASLQFDEGLLVFSIRAARARPAGAGRWDLVIDTRMDNRSSVDFEHGDWYYDGVVVGQRLFQAACFGADPAIVAVDTVGTGRYGTVVTCDPQAGVTMVLDGGARLLAVEGTPGAAC